MAPIAGFDILEQIFVFLILLQQVMLYPLLNLQAQAPAPAPAPPAPRARRRHTVWVKPWIQQRDDRGAYTTLMAELYNTDMPSFRNFIRMTPEFFEMLQERLGPRLSKQTTNWREPLSVGLKIATTLRYLATGETYTSLHYQFRAGKATISKFVTPVCRAILEEFGPEHLACPTTPEGWKELEAEFRQRWNVPHAVGALDGKHVAIRKPPKSGSLFHNYKGFFSVVLLALVDAEYRFRWVDVGTEGSCSDAQIFNQSELKERIEDGSIGFPEAEPIERGGPNLPYFILGDDAFALKTWLMKPYSVRGRGREYQIANYRLSRGRRVVENAFGILASRFRIFHQPILLKATRVKDIVMACAVLHNMLRAERGAGGGRAEGDLEDEVIPCQLEDGDAGAGRDRNPTQAAKDQRDYLKDWFNGAGAVPWQNNRV